MQSGQNYTNYFSNIFAFLLVIVISQSCAVSYKYSYVVDNEPIYEGDYRLDDEYEQVNIDNASSIKVVSFNIEFAENIDEAILLLNNEVLTDADVVLLQEMDESGTEKIAQALNMSYVYYPAIFHPKHQQNVGNAVLTKWEIKNSQKIKLPHPSSMPKPFEGKNFKFLKTATLAEVDINGHLISFASTHAAAFNTSQKKKEFASALAKSFEVSNANLIVVGGDFNTMGANDMNATVTSFQDCDFEWASKSIGKTVSFRKRILRVLPIDAFQLDHLFVKGLAINGSGAVEQKGISDHLPIWVSLDFSQVGE